MKTLKIVVSFVIFFASYSGIYSQITISDNFDDNSINASIWTQEAGSGTVEESGGAMKLNYRSGSSPHATIRTKDDLMDSQITLTCKIQPVYIAPNKNIGFWLGDINSSAVTGYFLLFHSTTWYAETVQKYYQYNGSNVETAAQPIETFDITWSNSSDFYKWHDIEITKNGNTYLFYVDGQLVARDTNPANQPTALYFSLGRPYKEVRVGEFGEVWLDDFNDNSLPVELSQFYGVNSEDNITVKWVTESEVDNLGFVLERKTNIDQTWVEIASYEYNEALRGKGNTSSRSYYEFWDYDIGGAGEYCYRLSEVSTGGEREIKDIICVTMEKKETDGEFALNPAFPNPFNPVTKIEYSLDAESVVNLYVYDIAGRLINRLLKDKTQPIGTYNIYWNGKDNFGNLMSSGTYLLLLDANGTYLTQKVTLIR